MNKITENRCFDTDKQRDLLLKALKGENNAVGSLAEVIGSDVNDKSSCKYINKYYKEGGRQKWHKFCGCYR